MPFITINSSSPFKNQDKQPSNQAIIKALNAAD